MWVGYQNLYKLYNISEHFGNELYLKNIITFSIFHCKKRVIVDKKRKTEDIPMVDFQDSEESEEKYD